MAVIVCLVMMLGPLVCEALAERRRVERDSYPTPPDPEQPL